MSFSGYTPSPASPSPACRRRCFCDCVRAFDALFRHCRRRDGLITPAITPPPPPPLPRAATSAALSSQSPVVSRQPPAPSVHETNDPQALLVPSSQPPQRQQQQQQQRPSPYQNPTSAFSSSSGSVQTLRRTSRFDQRPRASSVDSTSARAQPAAPVKHQRAASATRDDQRDRHPALRISSRTASAILYALEVGLRQPNQFTPDLVEEQASMSAFLGPSGPDNGNGNGNGNSPLRAGVGSSASPGLRTPRDIMRDRKIRDEARRMREQETAGPETVSQRSDQERRAAAERRLAAAGVGQSVRDSGYRSAGASAGNPSAGGLTPAEQAYSTPTMQGPAQQARPRGTSGYDTRQNVPSPYEPSEMPSRPAQASTARGYPPEDPQHRRTTSAPKQSSAPPQPAQPRQPQPSSQARATGPTSSGRGTSTQSGMGASSGDGGQRNSNVSTFPHAFERWETLSSRWEGLTSYWMRKLETNAPKADINQEMARQITDLAAAGANLFHAVVELQRLRASSERKFQRWFFETRAQQEQAQEDQARLRQALEQEQRAREQERFVREEDLREAQAMRNQDRLLQEYKRELQIAKDEAKRAWDELGRREAAERERIFSLKEGHTIDIGGVQVVPHGAPSRGGSQRSAQPDPIYATQQQQQPQQQQPQTGRGNPSQGGYQEYNAPSPTDTDPFSSGRTPAPSVPRPSAGSSYSQAAPRSSSMQAQPGTTSQPAQMLPAQSSTRAPPGTGGSPSARFYNQQGSSARPGGSSLPQAYAASDPESDLDYELDETGHIRTDAAGNPIRVRPRAEASHSHQQQGFDPREDIEAASDNRPRVRVEQAGPSRQSEQVAQAGAGMAPHAPEVPHDSPTGEYEAGDYEGRDYPEDDLEWAELQEQRHHHPTRLSDVPEEDERSRGSMSRPSRGSEGMF